MLPTEQQLSQGIADLSDEELLARLRSGDLTELAVDVIQRELAARGISAQSALANAPPVANGSSGLQASSRRFIEFFLKRVLRFPVNGVRGTEPLWVVIVFGGALLILVFKLAMFGLSELVLSKPVSPHLVPLSYALLSIYALAALWLGVALWRTVSTPPVLKLIVRVVALAVVLNCLLGSLGAARLIHGYFPSAPSDGPSIMDTPQ